MSSAENATIGRPRLFDEDIVLDRLLALFWRQGYSRTSMTDIVDASGVHKSSLYRTFGTKGELFATVLRRYLDRRRAVFAELVAASGTGTECVHRFLDLYEADVISGSGKDGCLMVTASNELRGSTPGYDDFAHDYRCALRHYIGQLVRQTRPTGEVHPDVLEQRTYLVSCYILGLQVIIRSGAGDEEIRSYFAAMHAAVDTWATD